MESRDILETNDLTSFFNAILTFKTQNPQNKTLVNALLSNAISYLHSLGSKPLSNSKSQVFIQQIKELEKLGAFDGVLSKIKLEAICLDIAAENNTIKQILAENNIQVLIQNLTESLHEQNIQLLKSTSLENSLDDLTDIIKEIQKLKKLPGSYRNTTELLELYHVLVKKCSENKQDDSAIHFSQEIIDYVNDQLLKNHEKYDAEVQLFLNQQIAKFHYTISAINFNAGKFPQSNSHAQKALAFYAKHEDHQDQEQFLKNKAKCINLIIMNQTEIIALLHERQDFGSVKQVCSGLFNFYMSHSDNPYIEIDQVNAHALLRIWYDVELSTMDKMIEQKSFLPFINTLQILVISAHKLGMDTEFNADVTSTWSKTVSLAFKHFLAKKDFESLHQMLKACEACLNIINMPSAINNVKLYKVTANYHHAMDLMANNNLLDAKSRFNAALEIIATLPQSNELKMLVEKIQQELRKIPSLNSSLYAQPKDNNQGPSYKDPEDKKNQLS